MAKSELLLIKKHYKYIATMLGVLRPLFFLPETYSSNIKKIPNTCKYLVFCPNYWQLRSRTTFCNTYISYLIELSFFQAWQYVSSPLYDQNVTNLGVLITFSLGRMRCKKMVPSKRICTHIISLDYYVILITQAKKRSHLNYNLGTISHRFDRYMTSKHD